MKQIDQNRIYDEQLYRQVKFMSNIGPSALPPDQLDRVRHFFFGNPTLILTSHNSTTD